MKPRELAFYNYILAMPKAESTAGKYTGAVRTVSEFLSGAGHIPSGTDLYDVDDPLQVSALREALFRMPAFIDKNTRGNHMYSKGVDWYCEFRRVNG